MSAEERWKTLRIIISALVPSGPGRPPKRAEAFREVLGLMDALEKREPPGPTCPAPSQKVVTGPTA